MADPKNGYNKYKTTSVQSASKEKILLMLYEAAIKHMKQAVVALENKKLADKGLSIGKAYDIVMELMNTLDHKVGGEIAKNLENLYIFVTDELTKANMNNSIENLQSAIKVMETLYTGWQQAIEKLKTEQKKTA